MAAEIALHVKHSLCDSPHLTQKLWLNMSYGENSAKAGHREYESAVVELWSSTVLGRGYTLGPLRT